MEEDESAELVTLTLDFLLKRPSDLPDLASRTGHAVDDFTLGLLKLAPFDPVVEDAVAGLRVQGAMIAPKDWEQQAGTSVVRPLTDTDLGHLSVILALVLADARANHYPRFLVMGPDSGLIGECFTDVGFGCVMGKLRAVALAGGLVTGVGFAADALGVADSVERRFFERPAYSIECSVSVTGPAEVAHLLRQHLRQTTTGLFNVTDHRCVILRQRALGLLGAYAGPADGIYGNGTAGAELALAARFDVEADDLYALYASIARRLDLLAPGWGLSR